MYSLDNISDGSGGGISGDSISGNNGSSSKRLKKLGLLLYESVNRIQYLILPRRIK